MRLSLFAAVLALAFALSSASAQEPSPTPSPSPSPSAKASPPSGGSSTSTDVRSPTSTSTEVRSPTSTSTEAHTSGNVTVTGGAGAGNTTVIIKTDPQAAQKLTGTVKAVHAEISHVELVLADGKTSGFYVNGDTKYVEGPGFSALADLKPGTRVVVDIKMEGDKKMATSVQLTGTKKASPAAPPPND